MTMKAAPGPGAPTTPIDGRRATRARNLGAVVDAMLELFTEGNLDPGAQEVADRSGVSRRSVFRYFDDMETLGRIAIGRMHDRVDHFVTATPTPGATLPERISELAEQRGNVFRLSQAGARVLRLRAPFRPLMQQELERNRRILDAQVQAFFEPEIAAVDESIRPETLLALQALYAFETYEALSTRGCDAETVSAVIRRTATAILTTPHG